MMELISRALLPGVVILAGVLLVSPYEAFLEGLIAFAIVAAVMVGFLMYPRREKFDGSQQRILTGIVLVEPGSPPPGRAMVTLFSITNRELSTVPTSSSGSFSIVGLGQGNYRIVVKLAGYQEAATEVAVYPGSTRTAVDTIILRRSVSGNLSGPEGTVDAREFRLNAKAKSEFEKAQRATIGDDRDTTRRLCASRCRLSES